ncbi:hypothetical protein E1A91_A06G182100v1 [Gossypium mustelinum]|uniref:Uncharacterized protein n=2 Tax=Gossypium TaxID=3633 RepID=A0A5J5VI09_GOSBA|nr:hypothetical protein ES319_A06G180500v1 [Gossypium barbadense]TYJ31194.1 hypothetical protein E1A91_A06G182100v1 [Gossypium mustelinum]
MTPDDIVLPFFSACSFTALKVASVNGVCSLACCYCWWSLPLPHPRARLTTLHLHRCAKTYNAYCFV